MKTNNANHPIRIAKILIVTFFVGYFGFLMIPKTNAMTPVQNVLSCEKAFNDGFFHKVPKVTMKRCSLIFQKMTWEFETGNYNPYQ